MSLLSLAGHISRYYKLTATQFFTSAAACREEYGDGGIHKFWLARQHAEFFSGGGIAAGFWWLRGLAPGNSPFPLPRPSIIG